MPPNTHNSGTGLVFLLHFPLTTNFLSVTILCPGPLIGAKF